MEEEIWKPVLYCIGYDVSNFGRIRSYYVNRYLRDTPQRISKLTEGNHGYYVVSIGHANPRLVHRMVLESFVGPSDLFGCHWDQNKKNNHLSNLRWDTQEGNASDRERHGTRWIGSVMPTAKLSYPIAVKIREEYAIGNISQRALGLKYGVHQMTISQLLSGETWGGEHARSQF